MKQNIVSQTNMPNSFLEIPPEKLGSEKLTTEKSTAADQKMLVYRLTEAARRIREETELIRRSSFSDSGARLMRILGETVEEQRQSILSRDGSLK